MLSLASTLPRDLLSSHHPKPKGKRITIDAPQGGGGFGQFMLQPEKQTIKAAKFLGRILLNHLLCTSLNAFP